MDNLEDMKTLAEQWLNQGIELVEPIETEIFTASYILFLTIMMLLFDRFFGSTKPGIVLFAGLSGSGKTVIFHQLRGVSLRQGAVTSIEPNDGTSVLHTEITMSGKLNPVRLVDVPDHPHFRSILERCLPQAAAVVFVVDSLEFLQKCRAASEFLYDILTNASVVTNRIPLLLCCNKTEKVSAAAHSKGFICRQMEKEMSKISTERNDFTLRIEGEVFSFSQCRNTVTVAETSGLAGETDQVQEFIREHVRP